MDSILCVYYISWKENKHVLSCIFDFPKQDYIKCMFRWTFEYVFPDHPQNTIKCVFKKCINESYCYDYLYKLYIRLYFYSDMVWLLLLVTFFSHKCMTPSKTQRTQMKNKLFYYLGCHYLTDKCFRHKIFFIVLFLSML